MNKLGVEEASVLCKRPGMQEILDTSEQGDMIDKSVQGDMTASSLPSILLPPRARQSSSTDGIGHFHVSEI